jgi:16S rRNA (cytosine967-C5)-methyltransferase
LNDQNPRQIAARILSQRLTSGEFTENLLEMALGQCPLSPADRGLCHELVCGVVRWQAALDRLIARKTTPGREQRPALQNLLRLGLYQIFWLDRIPPHAAVHETVELAKRSWLRLAGRLCQRHSARLSARGRRDKKFSPT